MKNLDILQRLGDFFVKHKNKELFDESIESYYNTIHELYLQVFQTDLYSSPFDITGEGWVLGWTKFDTSTAELSGSEYYIELDQDYLSVPILMPKIDEPIWYWYEGTDYYLADDKLFFKQEPPDYLYANRVMVNRYDLYNLYGSLLGLTKEKDSEIYLYKIQALWRILKSGATPNNLRLATYVFHNLPFAYEDAVVTEGTSSSLTLTAVGEHTYTYELLGGLTWEVSTGDHITKYQPLSSGIHFYDYWRDPLIISKLPASIIATYIVSDDPTPAQYAQAERWLPYSIFAIGVSPGVYNVVSRDNLLAFLRRVKPAYVNVEILGEVEANITMQLCDTFDDSIGKDFTTTVWSNPVNTYGFDGYDRVLGHEAILLYDTFTITSSGALPDAPEDLTAVYVEP